MPSIQTTIIAVIVLALAIIALRIWKGRRGEPALSHIHLCVPFRGAPTFDASWLVQEFAERWQRKVACRETERLSSGRDGETAYLLMDGVHHMHLTVHSRPLPPQLVEVTIGGAPYLSDEDRATLRDHKAAISVSYLFGNASPAERVRFAAETLLSILRQQGAIGYVNVSGMLYRPQTSVEDFLRSDDLDCSRLYLLFANTHSVADDDSFWIHTHGMEQFDLPDLQVRFTDEDRHSYYWELISDAAIYMIDSGPVLKPGHTAELKGDGVIFRISSGRAEADHPFGARGVLEFSPAT